MSVPRTPFEFAVAALVFASACSSSAKAPAAPPASSPPAPTAAVEVLPPLEAGAQVARQRANSTRSIVEIQSVEATNHGGVLHMMLRQLDPKAMGLVESYEQAASFVVAQVRDDSVLTVQPVIPGHSLTLAVQADPKKKLVAYFFFTNPGQNWRVELPRPLPRHLAIKLGTDQIDGLEGAR